MSIEQIELTPCGTASSYWDRDASTLPVVSIGGKEVPTTSSMGPPNDCASKTSANGHSPPQELSSPVSGYGKQFLPVPNKVLLKQHFVCFQRINCIQVGKAWESKRGKWTISEVWLSDKRHCPTKDK